MTAKRGFCILGDVSDNTKIALKILSGKCASQRPAVQQQWPNGRTIPKAMECEYPCNEGIMCTNVLFLTLTQCAITIPQILREGHARYAERSCPGNGICQCDRAGASFHWSHGAKMTAIWMQYCVCLCVCRKYTTTAISCNGGDNILPRICSYLKC